MEVLAVFGVVALFIGVLWVIEYVWVIRKKDREDPDV